MARSPSVPPSLRHVPFRGADAVAGGLLTREQLRHPVWRRLFRDVYVHTDVVLDHLTWCAAAALSLPEGAVLSHRSAMYLWGADVLPLQAPVEACVAHGVRAPGSARLLVRHASLEPSDLRWRSRLRVTSQVRTAFDVGRGPDLTEAVVGLDAMLARRLVSPSAVLEYAAARPGWPGIRRLSTALDLAEPHVESPMESRLRLVLVLGGLPRPLVQFPVHAGGRFVARVDLAYRERRLALEYDGDHHRDRATFRQDVRRLNALRLAGWTVLRFTADDVLRHPSWVVAQVRALI